VWLHAPQWPLSRSTSKPMIFVGQIALDRTGLFPGAVAQMVYLFISSDPVELTADPDAGENAVVLQPGSPNAPYAELYKGPTISAYDPATGTVEDYPAEFAVRLSPSSEPDFTPSSQWMHWSKDELRRYMSALGGNKIGGSPLLANDASIPFKDWQLILQLDSDCTPFFINFGFGGTGYVIANANCTSAKFMWLSG
jgi:hypothetical protein